MRGIDLSRFRFDYGLTLAALAAHPDGTVHHRYGGRDHRGSAMWQGEASYAAFLRAGLAAHAAYVADPKPPVLDPPLAVEDIPSFAAKDQGRCIHCHNVRPSLAAEAAKAGRWDERDAWRDPSPLRIGLDVDAVDQARVTAVEAGSAADAAGLAVGDRLRRVGEVSIATATDLVHALDRIPVTGGRAEVVVERSGAEERLELALAEDWKVGTPLEMSWRPIMWDLSPRVGFGGKDLSAEEKRELGLAEDAFAFRVTYLVDWGPARATGEAAAAAGVQKGDVVVGADGRRDFAGHNHFHAWWRLEREPGDRVEVELLREGEPATASLVIPAE